MNLKRLLAGVLACCVVYGALPSVRGTADNAVITANAEATVPSNLTLVGKGSEGDFSCNYYSDGSLLIDGYDGKESVVTIPESINGKKVRSLMVDSYFGSTIKDIHVPSSVALIGSTYNSYTYADAFRIMYDKGITLHMAGYDIPEIEEVPYTYSKLEDGTIEITGWDKSATEAVIPNEINLIAVTSIGDSAFSRCTELTEITIPDSVTSICESAFSGCTGLTEITIPDGVTSIGERTFYECSGLTSVIIPDNVTSIGHYAFYRCSGLTSIFIPNSVTSIGYNAFHSCLGLTSINIPNSVTSIDGLTFYECKSLTEITIPDGVTSIGNKTFQYCSELTSIAIPDSVTSIGGGAFTYTPWLENKQKENPLVIVNCILISGKTCSGDVTIPDGVISICGSAFSTSVLYR